ncbi:MAG: YdjY domain-containing protein [Planctomycetota bacterium]|jgi:hypothetical protein
MRIVLSLLLIALAAIGQDEKQEPPVDVGKVLRESKEFAAKCKEFQVTWSEGVVRSVGQVYYRGGGPCEYLVGVFPANDKGPFEGEGHRPREPIYGLAEVINNAFLAAGFTKGKPFDWDRETGDVFVPKGETTYVYCEWESEKGKLLRARMCDWLWNFKLLEVMQPGKIVYTGSLILDEGPPTHKKWLGAEVDGLVVAILNTSTALMDNIEDGGLDNGAYEAIPIRIPPAGTRVAVAFSKKKLEVTEDYPALKLPKELEEEKRKRAEEAARKKLDEPKKEEGKTE